MRGACVVDKVLTWKEEVGRESEGSSGSNYYLSGHVTDLSHFIWGGDSDLEQ